MPSSSGGQDLILKWFWASEAQGIDPDPELYSAQKERGMTYTLCCCFFYTLWGGETTQHVENTTDGSTLVKVSWCHCINIHHPPAIVPSTATKHGGPCSIGARAEERTHFVKCSTTCCMLYINDAHVTHVVVGQSLHPHKPIRNQTKGGYPC